MTAGPLFAVLLAFVASAFAAENHALMAVKNMEQFNAKFLAKMAKPFNVTADGDFVLFHYYDVKDCSGEEIQYVAYKTGVCYTAGSGSNKWSCNGGKHHSNRCFSFHINLVFLLPMIGTANFEQWTSADCSGSSDGGNNFSSDQCFPQTEATYEILATSFSCASSYVPAGSWYTTAGYTDSGCQNMYMASHLKNQYCQNLGAYSMKIDYPKEYMYMSANDCTGTAYESDLSYMVNQCFASGTAGTTQATKTFFSQA